MFKYFVFSTLHLDINASERFIFTAQITVFHVIISNSSDSHQENFWCLKWSCNRSLDSIHNIPIKSRDHRKAADFRLMTELSPNCVSMSVSLPLGLDGQRSKAARPSGSETLMITQLRESWAFRLKWIEELDCFSVPEYLSSTLKNWSYKKYALFSKTTESKFLVVFDSQGKLDIFFYKSKSRHQLS